MRTLRYNAAGNRSGNLLHIETDGCIVNIHVGLADAEGRLVTRVDVLPDAKSRGGDGQGRFWDIHEDDGNGVTRVVHNPLAEERQTLAERFPEYGATGTEDGNRDVLELREALAECATAAESDSNDGEILALNQALDLALSRWPEISRTESLMAKTMGGQRTTYTESEATGRLAV